MRFVWRTPAIIFEVAAIGMIIGGVMLVNLGVNPR